MTMGYGNRLFVPIRNDNFKLSLFHRYAKFKEKLPLIY